MSCVIIVNESPPPFLINIGETEHLPKGDLILVRKENVVLHDELLKDKFIHINRDTLNVFFSMSNIWLAPTLSDCPSYLTKKCISLPLFKEVAILSKKKELSIQEQIRAQMLLFAIMADFMKNPSCVSFFSFIINSETSSRVRNIINNRIDYSWTMSALAKEMALSVSSLKKKLKYEGVTYSSLLRECRMKKAIYLLANKNITTKKVAAECGFKSASYFICCFKKYFGCTPLEYTGYLV
ncbi:helix-turn-helix domain-containing protein [Escherichia coli]|uniref:helix-turn-helix domain-containing protein n=1 Tax=Escherichia coli TaxID=562 RepID=UPI0038B2B1E3